MGLAETKQVSRRQRRDTMCPMSEEPNHESASRPLTRFHLQFGWWSLLLFLSLGISLEVMGLLKVTWYVDAAHEVRKLMWRLGHAHGTLLSVVHIGFGITMFHSQQIGLQGWQRWGSRCLTGASFLLPGGFLLGGVYHYEGDPGPGIFAVPVGAMLLLLGVMFAAWGSGREPS